MKNLLTTQQLRDKYNPDEVLEDINKAYENNVEKLKTSLKHKNSPLRDYSIDKQISFLDRNNLTDNNLIEEITPILKDAIYFMILSKQNRTMITQRMRGFYSGLITNYLQRINYFIDDPEIILPKQYNDPTPRHKGIEYIFNILKLLKVDLEFEQDYRKKLPRSGYLTGLQVAMGKFFVKLNLIGLSQREQITLVQLIFDVFKVDWEEGDRENIKLSLQYPAIEYYKITMQDIQKIPSYLFSKSLTDSLVSNLIEQATILKKRSRRF